MAAGFNAQLDRLHN